VAGELETTQRSVPGPGDRLAIKVPALTLVCHSDLGRVGQRVRLVELGEGGAGEAAVSRLAPRFADPGRIDQPGEPIGEPSVSRSPLRIRRRADGELEIEGGGGEVRVDGRALGERTVVPAARLADGVVIELGTRVVVLLHELGPPVAAPAPLGLVGASEVLDDLRRALLRAADQDNPVLLGAARGVTAAGRPDGGGEHGGAAAANRGGGAVRPRARRVHRRGRRAQGPLPGGGRRHPVPRRDR
jgi:hypothetical protein